MKNKNIHTMKQPALGKKILELRKEKGLTQEELVELCNINVRTIQRIEAGEVNPRSYTIKAILEVLDFNYDDVFQEDYQPSKFDAYFGIDKSIIQKQLNLAIVFGIIYFVAGFFEVGIGVLNLKEESFLYRSIYIVIKSISITSLFFFFRGFIILGTLYKNYLLQISAALIILISMFLAVLDVVSIYIYKDFIGVLSFSKLVTFGILSVILGVAFKRLTSVGKLARWTGIVEIITGVCFLLIILSPIAVFTQALAEILEIILLYKIVAIYKK